MRKHYKVDSETLDEKERIFHERENKLKQERDKVGSSMKFVFRYHQHYPQTCCSNILMFLYSNATYKKRKLLQEYIFFDKAINIIIYYFIIIYRPTLYIISNPC